MRIRPGGGGEVADKEGRGQVEVTWNNVCLGYACRAARGLW